MSTTANERKALLFLSAVILAGSVVRVARAVGVEAVPAADSAALDRQIARVDAARAAKASSGKGGAGKKPARAPKGAAARVAASAGVVYPPALPPSQRLARDSIVDVDRAGAAELERLPWIGPVLAQRIVDDRNSKGPFGSLEAFQRVRGVGPGLAERLRTRVTFSAAGRH